MPAAADRHVLLGLLALQNGLVTESQLVLALEAWTLDKSRSLAHLLEARGVLTAPGGRSWKRWPRSTWKRTVATSTRAWPRCPPANQPASV